MKAYKWFRGLLKVSAFTSIMFVMQACYGMPHDDYAYENYDFDSIDSLNVTQNNDVIENVEDIVEADSEVVEANE